MIYLLVPSVALNVSLALAVRALWRARDRTYTYAVERSDLTEKGSAYSDMATVIVLDGKVDRGSMSTDGDRRSTTREDQP